MALQQPVTQLAALLIGCALLPVSSFAQRSFQSHQVVPGAGGVSAHGDFNNDGREDVVVGNQLYLSSGDGTYRAPIALPGRVDVIGDFNHDGKLDFASSGYASGNGVVVYLGNGDGTFQSPRTVTSTAYRLVAADVNHDNKTDLVTASFGNSVVIQVWISNGDGTFSKGQSITTSNPADPNVQITQMFTGDFDGDGKPDIAVHYSFIGPSTVQVFYGDGAGHLGSPYAITDPKQNIDSPFVVADVNNDGRSDLVLVAATTGPRYGDYQPFPLLTVFSGNANRTMSYSTIATAQCPASAAVADFNGDGRNDLAYNETSCDQSIANTEVVIREGAGSGFAAEQTIYQNVNGTAPLSAIRSTTGTRPDLVFGARTGTNSSAIVLLSNTSTGAFPGCGATVAEGIRICTPGVSATSPVTFSIGAAGPTPMRTGAVWVDGKKVVEQLAHAFSNYSFLDASIPLAAGSHAITVYGTGVDDTLQQKSFTLTVGGGGTCSSPGSAGVNVCAPVNGATVSSPVQVLAAATITGTLARMEVWVDGVKKYTETSSKSLSTSIALGAGSHRFDVYAVNTAGTKWEKTVTATVK